MSRRGRPRTKFPGPSPTAPAGVPTCPDWLPPAAKAKWAETVPLLVELGTLTLADGDTLAMYCAACNEVAEAIATLDKEGRYVPGASGGLKPHPALAQLRYSMAAQHKYAGLFGLDPSSRNRLRVQPRDPQLDAFDALKPPTDDDVGPLDTLES